MADVASLVRAPFPRYWLSSFLADFGDGVRLAAFPLLAARLTNSPAAVAAVTALQGLPWIAVGLGVGTLVDRWNLRSIMVWVDVARAAVIAALAAAVMADLASLSLIYAAAFITGIGALVRDTASSTALPRLVSSSDLDRANGRLTAGRLVGDELAGPAVGSWLFGVAAAVPFAANAGGLGLSILLLLTLPSVFAARPRPAETGLLRSAVTDMRTGLVWVWQNRIIRNLVIAVGLVAAADGAYLAILVLYVTRVLSQSPAAYGLLIGFGAVGGIAASTASARLARRFGAQRLLVTSILTMAAAQLTLGLISNVIVAAAMLAASSGAFAAFNITSISLRQRLAPAVLLGRVNSAYLTVGRSAEALGALLGGGIAGFAGIRAPILAGIPLILAAAVLVAQSRNRQGRSFFSRR